MCVYVPEYVFTICVVYMCIAVYNRPWRYLWSSNNNYNNGSKTNQTNPKRRQSSKIIFGFVFCPSSNINTQQSYTKSIQFFMPGMHDYWEILTRGKKKALKGYQYYKKVGLRSSRIFHLLYFLKVVKGIQFLKFMTNKKKMSAVYWLCLPYLK